MEESSSQSLVGRELDKRYKILSPIGEGGFGAVFLGEHIRIGRQVAIKVLSPELARSDDFIERFQREAIAAGRLDHPNCVPVTDSGQLEDGTAYLVMEFVDGRSLGSLLKSEGPRLHPIRALRIIRHVLRGLGHAHEMGIVHRDIKPDNIMVCELEDDSDFARVLDFGIAKLRDDDTKDRAALTQAGMAVGTPAYLSPEQALGDKIDERSDIYSCAVVLFDMLCGAPPFDADNPIGILTKHASADVPHLWDIAPELEDFYALDALVQHGLKKHREDRFQNAGEFVAAIDMALVQLGAQLTPVPDVMAPPYPDSGPVVRHPSEAGLPQPGGLHPSHAGPSEIHPRHQSEAEPPARGRSHFGPRRAWIAAAALLAMVLGIALISGEGAEDADEVLVIPGVNVDAQLVEFQSQLRNGKTCEERLAAVHSLEALGDKRAIPSLRKARRRMRGGVLGVGKSNTNKCLVKAVRDAIRSLEER